MALRGRKVLVVGLGSSGQAAARLAIQHGADVTCADLRADLPPIPGARMALGPHRRELFLQSDLVVVSPGIPAAQPDIAAAVAAGVAVIGELAFAWGFLTAPAVAITGTNGKSTVTWFTGQLLRAAGFRPFVGGNLGRPLSLAALEQPDADVLVVEVSSYQLELPGALAPRVGLVLNLTPDHLARHGDMDGYGRAKCRLFERMGEGDLAVLPVGDERLIRLADGVGGGARAWLGALPGVRRDGRQVELSIPGVDARFDLSSVTVPGEHNLDNVASAILAAVAMGAQPGAVQAALGSLVPLEHRMEVVAEHAGVLWINDSKATNVDASRVGVSGMDRPCVVLLGGEAKGRGFAELAPSLGRHRAVIAFGASGPAIRDELVAVGVDVALVPGMPEAVSLARALARAGDAVLLSPGCASFDAYDNFEHRGRVFRDLVTRRSP